MITLNIISLEEFSLSTGLEVRELEVGQKVTVKFESLKQAESFADMGLFTILDDDSPDDVLETVDALLAKRKEQVAKMRKVQDVLRDKSTSVEEVEKEPVLIEEHDDIDRILAESDESESFSLSQDLSIPENEISEIDIEQVTIDKPIDEELIEDNSDLKEFFEEQKIKQKEAISEQEPPEEEEEETEESENAAALKRILEGTKEEEPAYIPVVGKLDRRRKYRCKKCKTVEMDSYEKDEARGLLIMNCPKCQAKYSLECN